MKRRSLIAVSTLIITAVAALLISSQTVLISAQNPTPTPTPYNPYPPGILPADLTTEIARVQREIQFIFNQALGEMAALPLPLTPTGQPPTLQGSGYQGVQTLGKLMNFDQNMSPFRNEACAFCHMPYAGFSGPIPSVNLTMIAYPGTFHFRAGKRTAQRYTYSPNFPQLQYNAIQDLFFGGNLWHARSTGYLLQSPDAEQALHPPVDTQEMGFPDTACIAFRLSQAVYRPLFELVWGAGSLDFRWPHNTEKICATPGGATVFSGSTTPIPLTPEDRTKAGDVYNHWGESLSAFEHSPAVSASSSKFDALLASKYTLTADEMAGYNLFRRKANCSSCHLDGRSATLQPGQTDTGTAANVTPMFTCFRYANLGLHLHPTVALFYLTQPDD